MDNVNPSYTNVLGITDQIDYGNVDHADGARVFFDHFGDGEDQLNSPTKVGVALGTVAAHEAGHLLGLRHVNAIEPAEDLMGRLSGLGWLLTVPAFGTYDLYESPSELWGFDVDNGFDVFGKQNSAAVLQTTIGSDPIVGTGIRILGTDPVAGGPMVARNANITIDFSEPIDFSTLERLHGDRCGLNERDP